MKPAMEDWRTTLLDQAKTLTGPIVLIAEDNSDIRELTKLLLENEGCRVIEAVDGREAVDLARCSAPDLILVDIRMPFLDGVEVTRSLRQTDCTRHIPILALTNSHERRREAIDAGCNDFLAKPLLPEAIRRFLKQYERHFTHHESKRETALV
jgi:CheY-like chemotaxis protein